MKYKGVIFDLDGVLCFTDEYHYQAWKMLADRSGIKFDKKDKDKLRGVSRMEILRIVLGEHAKEYNEEQLVALATEKNDSYRKLLLQMKPSDVSNDVRTTLEELKKKGIKLSIGSSSKNTPTIIEKVDIKKYFDTVSDGNNITHSKPDPEVFLKAAEFLHLDPKDCLVVEDAEAGIDAAVAGGFYSAGIGSASSYHKATYSINKLSDILKL